MPTTSHTVGGTASAPDTACTISFGNSVALTDQLYAINLASGDALDGRAYNGPLDHAGQVSVNDLTVQNARATGGRRSWAGRARSPGPAARPDPPRQDANPTVPPRSSPTRCGAPGVVPRRGRTACCGWQVLPNPDKAR